MYRSPQPGGIDNNGDAKGDDKPKLEIPEAVDPSLEKDGNINAQELSDGVVAKVTCLKEYKLVMLL
ncbi:hypothetical protein INT80_14510 [Gallibacterium anatis]|uniref:Uncharacterized protein n=1 Tax=Gallibacterium anatis TaxID=750 RepID=A0A930UUR1_9PAST|nr:hypothetical protein [Gallibacterium anatis]